MLQAFIRADEYKAEMNEYLDCHWQSKKAERAWNKCVDNGWIEQCSDDVQRFTVTRKGKQVVQR